MENKLKGYVLAIIRVRDPETFKEYVARTPAAVNKYGGKFISRGVDYSILEGTSLPARIVLVEFASVAIAHDFYHSKEYQEAAFYRRQSSETDFFILNGYDSDILAKSISTIASSMICEAKIEET
jgi:uncharacterized protein (DUF1330 family)